ncbi:MAG TPA: glycosyl hydrolase family 79 C-terminal domain-containing protein [Candidatus Acidoferrum sp.]|nr:glycosyl hydrolase family 79 C-terminal domain-containing protein [Candidatus Acidoferrum sp.]
MTPSHSEKTNRQSPIANSRLQPGLRIGQAAVLALLLGGRAAEAAEVPVTVTIESAQPGRNISSDFLGLSYETALLLPGSNGKYFFTPENKALVQMFRTLGVKSLRVGGNTAERESVQIPGRRDIDSLFAFAQAAGVKVIYTLRLKGADPQADADIAKYIMDHYRSDLTCFALGNEPEKMAKDYAGYRDEFRRFVAVIAAPTNVPVARFCGPSTTHKNAAWAGQFAREFGGDKRVALVTQHEYPARSGTNIPSVAAASDRLLSPALLKVYETFGNEFVPAAASNGLPYRLEEANSFSNGGAAGVSDAFAAALWGLDYLYWWAGQGADGINFHTGGYVPGTKPHSPMKYAVFWNAGEGFAASPLAYAMEAFSLVGAGRLLPVRITTDAGPINLWAYAVLAPDHSLRLALINKEHGAGGKDAQVSIAPGKAYVRGEAMFLTAPGNSVEAKSGVTLGGGAIDLQGNWKGSWTHLAAPSAGGAFKLPVPAASAAIVRLAER